MKTTTLSLLILTIAVGVGTSGCDSDTAKKDNKKSTSVEEKIADTYESQVAEFKKKMAKRIEANEKIAAEFKQRIRVEKYEAKVIYEEKIAALEQQNLEMKRMMEDYQAESEESWEAFKSDFNQKMDDLGNAISDLTGDDEK